MRSCNNGCSRNCNDICTRNYNDICTRNYNDICTRNYNDVCMRSCNCHILTLDPSVNQETGASGRRYQGITLMGLIRCNCDAHKKQVGVQQLYNLVPQTVRVSWSQFVGVRFAVRGSENQLETEGLGPQDPRLSSPAEREKECCYNQMNWGSICYSLFSLQLTSHRQSFHNPLA